MTSEHTSIIEDRVAVVGCGHVGTTAAYALMLSRVVRELVLVDLDRHRAEGEAMDLRHAVPMGRPVRVFSGTYADAARAAIVVIAAGVGSQPGETRLDLAGRNVRVVRSVMKELLAKGFAGIVLMTTNPVDVLAQVAQEESGLPVGRVIGSGTVLDSSRLRAMIGDALGVEARSVHAYIVGEHGDSEIAAWSSAHIAGVPLHDYCRQQHIAPPDLAALLQRVRHAAPEIIQYKGYTSFAIASCVATICEAILRDERSVLPVSTLLSGQHGIDGVYLSLPCVIGRSGIERVIELPLNEAEQAGLEASAEVLRRTLDATRI